MTHYRSLGIEQAQQLLDSVRSNTVFPEWQMHTQPVAMTDGALHSVYKLDTSQGSFIIKFFEKVPIHTTVSTLEERYAMQRNAFACGAAVPELIVSAEIEGNTSFYIEREVPGKKTYPPTPEQAFMIGQAVARFHNSLAEEPLFQNKMPSLLRLGAAETLDGLARVFSHPGSIVQDFQYAVTTVRYARHYWIINRKTAELPHGKIHGDVNEGNVMLTEERAFLLDFELMRDAPLIEDIAGQVYHFSIVPDLNSYRFNLPLATALLRGYDQERTQGAYGPITEREIAILPEMLAAYARYREMAEMKLTLSDKNITLIADRKKNAAHDGAEQLKGMTREPASIGEKGRYL